MIIVHIFPIHLQMQFQIPMKLYNQFIILIYFTCEINFIMKLHNYIELLKLINVKITRRKIVICNQFLQLKNVVYDKKMLFTFTFQL